LENQFSSELSKLHGHPFSSTASTDRPYLSSSFREALSSLYYGLEYGTRVLLLSAEPGVGKTTLLHYWERRIQQRGRTLLVSSNADNAADMLLNLTVQIGGFAPGDLNVTGLQTYDVLRTLETSPGNPFLLQLDFKENSAGSALKILNHLTTFESFKTKSLRVVIAVRDQVAEQLQRSEFAHDIKRVPLDPLMAAEVEGYIEYRLRMAGWRGGPLFTPKGYASIAERSSGNPSVINEICFKLLQRSESQNDRSDKKDHNQRFPIDDPFVDSVISGQKSASTQPPDNIVDQVASPTAPLNRLAATITIIVLMLVIAIGGLWYEIAAKANPAKRVSISTIPTPNIAQTHEIPQDRTVARSSKEALKTSATDVAAKAAAVSTVAVHITPRVVSPSPAAVSLKDAGYSPEPVGQKDLRFSNVPPSPRVSPSAIATLSSAPAQTPPAHSAIASGQPSRAEEQTTAEKEEEAAAAKPTAEEMAAHEIRLGDTYMKRGEYDKALFSFSRALAFAPNDQEAQEKTRRAAWRFSKAWAGNKPRP
jgi:MSHA biogenesis protein MshM